MSLSLGTNSDISAVILAGGRARRMGGQDKGLIEVNGRAMVDYVIQALRPQVAELMINANRNFDQYERLGNCRVISDELDGFIGPLAGMASAMRNCRTPYLMVVPCDCPLITSDLATRLLRTLEQNNSDVSSAHDGDRLQPVFALLRCALLPDLMDYLEAGHRKIDQWYETQRFSKSDFSDRLDMFLNINTPGDRDRLEMAMSKTT